MGLPSPYIHRYTPPSIIKQYQQSNQDMIKSNNTNKHTMVDMIKSTSIIIYLIQQSNTQIKEEGGLSTNGLGSAPVGRKIVVQMPSSEDCWVSHTHSSSTCRVADVVNEKGHKQ